MYDESGFLLLLRVLMAILMFSMEMEIGEEKKKSKDGKYQKCMVMQYSIKMICKRSIYLAMQN